MMLGVMFGNKICPNSDETISLAIKHAQLDYNLFKNDNKILPESRKKNFTKIYCSDNYKLYKDNYIKEFSRQYEDIKKKSYYTSCVLALVGAIVIYENRMNILYHIFYIFS